MQGGACFHARTGASIPAQACTRAKLVPFLVGQSSDWREYSPHPKSLSFRERTCASFQHRNRFESLDLPLMIRTLMVERNGDFFIGFGGLNSPDNTGLPDIVGTVHLAMVSFRDTSGSLILSV
jgi:hypothetical protein